MNDIFLLLLLRISIAMRSNTVQKLTISSSVYDLSKFVSSFVSPGFFLRFVGSEEGGAKGAAAEHTSATCIHYAGEVMRATFIG